MGDISSWSPVDNSNTAAPPDGWPENQSPSSVNNCARAMMGAVRRWYDTVTAQLSTLTTSLSSYLPLTGGTMTGGLVVPLLDATVNLTVGPSSSPFAQIYDGGCAFYRVSSFNEPVYAQSVLTAETILYVGSGGASAEINSVGCYFQKPSYFYAPVTVNGNINASGNINATSGNITGLYITALSEGFFGSLSCSGAISAGPVYASFFSTTGTITADGLITANGGIYCSSGNIHANGDITTNADIHVDHDIFCSGNVRANGDIYCNGNIAGTFSLTGTYLHATGNVSADTGFAVGPGGAYAQINSSGSFNVTGAWSVISDQSVKEQVMPYTRGLAAIAALSPVTFRYQPGVPFADGAEHVGLMAQDVELIMPELVGQVTIGDQTLSTLTPGNLVYVLCNALKELAARVEQMEAAQKE